MDPPDGDKRVDPEQLEEFAKRILEGAAVPERNASAVAESLVLSNVSGHNSHGVRRLPMYVRSIQGDRDDAFRIDPTAEPTVIDEGPSHVVIDGRNALGHLVGRVSVDRTIERTEDQGMCVVGARNATHLGRVGEWSERVAEAGFLHLAFVAVHGARTVAPAGSAQPRFGTNPLSFGVPTFDALPHPIVFDGATSQVANGKTKEAAAAGSKLPADWAVAEGGESVRDATTYRRGEGALLPLGGRTAGYKGFALAIIAELFGAIAADDRITAQLEHIRGNAALFVTIDPTLFTTPESIRSIVTALSDYVESTAYDADVSPGDGAYGDRAYLPGAPEYLTTRDRLENGIPMPSADFEALRLLALELDVEEPALC